MGDLKILVLGPSSMIARQFLVSLDPETQVVTAGRTAPSSDMGRSFTFHPVDLSNEGNLDSYLRKIDADVWVNFAARTNVDECEKDRPHGGIVPGIQSADETFQINAALPRWLGEEAARQGRRVLHVSTDAVFDGLRGPYSEDEVPSLPSSWVSWYGYTKGVGETALVASGCSAAIVRISYPFGAPTDRKADFARRLLKRAASGNLHPLYTDQKITPSWIPDVSDAMARLTAGDACGTFHVASPELTTPLEFAQILLRAAGFSDLDLKGSSLRDAILRGERAARPINGGLRVGRIRTLGVEPRSFASAIDLLALGK